MKTLKNLIEIPERVISGIFLTSLIGLIIYNSIVHGTYSAPW
jgi:hypothetical protein